MPTYRQKLIQGEIFSWHSGFIILSSIRGQNLGLKPYKGIHNQMFVITVEGCHQEHYSRFCIEHSRHLAPPGGVSGPARSSSPTSSCAPSVCATPAIDRSHPNVKVELANGEGQIFFSNPGHKLYDLNLELEFRNVFFYFQYFTQIT